MDRKAGDAAHRGILGAGFYHKALADEFVRELRERADELWSNASGAVDSVNGSLSEGDVAKLKQYLEDQLRRESAELTERLRARLRGVDAPAWLLAMITDEVPNLVDDTNARVDLFARRRTSAAIASKADPARADGEMPDPARVFVVHGRDSAIRNDLFSFLKALGLHPIEWREAVQTTRKGSPYIGEILQGAFRTAQAVVVLLTPDDEVRLTPELVQPDDGNLERSLQMQARPNVLFEAGMAFGHQPDRTILVEVGTTKPFSDVAGRHVIRLTNDVARRQDMIDRLRTAGCKLDTSGTEWQSSGNFEVNRKTQLNVADPGRAPSPIIKHVDLNYPADSGVQQKLMADGYEVAWVFDSKVARKMDLEGWSLATDVDKAGREVTFKMHDNPEDQTLLKRRAPLP